MDYDQSNREISLAEIYRFLGVEKMGRQFYVYKKRDKSGGGNCWLNWEIFD